ncbi:dCTP deaminase domain-containing protein [Litchfieldia salsa]|uniref:Deoxycytidine triphosphate deaminase n=1 Tax=Litchfieldia salsa TaxID=930152 RepID=A0A1H0NZW5_9BACI|nr:hypothetical protein [Litchfieldia salsa]SDO98254.1 deoxycytidine triphosphate deaminase [Litchfieldia salsa]
MSIVPFVLSGVNKSIVTKTANFNLNGQCILIKNLDEEQINNADDTNISYDLRVGCEYRDHRDLNKTDLNEDGTIKLLPGTAVIIETLEYVHFPEHRFGQILPKVGLLQVGISNTTSKIDPGYNGNLLITVFNLGKRTEFLKRNQKFCSLIVQEVGPGVRTYDKDPKKLPGRSKTSIIRNLRDGIDSNAGSIATGALLISAILAAFTLYQIITG